VSDPAPLHHQADGTTWPRAGYISALLLTAAIGYFLLHLPIDISENILAITSVQDTTLGTLMTRGGVIRPGGWILFKTVLDGSFGHPFEGFRLLNTLSLAGIFLFGVHVLRVRTAQEWGVALLTLMVMVGIHPFHDSVRETAVNHHIIVPCLLLAAVSVAMAAHRWWSDGLAVLILLAALLLVEAGVLVWVAIAAAWLTGLRGITTRGVAIGTALLATYLILHFLVLDLGAPAFGARSTGFGFHVMEPPEIRARFGDNPLPLYAYNVVAAGLSVLVSEPRAGVFSLIDQLRHGSLLAGSVLNVLTSLLTTGILIWFVTQRWASWRRREFTRGDRLFLIGAAVCGANAAISFSQLKDVVLTTGALLYALAVFPALAHLLDRLERPPLTRGRAAVACALLLAVSIGWTMRAALFFVDIRMAAYRSQSDWVMVEEWIASQEQTPLTEAQRATVRAWRSQMLAMPVPRAYLSPAWLEQWDPH
jgi:hypothetical protein